jgi:hypothetical protein
VVAGVSETATAADVDVGKRRTSVATGGWGLSSAFALVCCGLKNAGMILASQVWRQQCDRRQREGAIFEHGQRDRKPPDHACGRDAPVGRVFRQVQPLGAEHKQGRVAEIEIEPPAIDFRDRGDQGRARRALARDERMDFGDQLGIGELRKPLCIHDAGYKPAVTIEVTETP